MDLPTIAPGDVLCMYTDGVTEARDVKGEEFEIERLERTLPVHGRQSTPDVDTAVRSSVEALSGLSTRANDMHRDHCDRKESRAHRIRTG